jgi:DMSO/TMAO reductase YedYZ molybdopterin-dependent catalytic subunit
MFFGVYKQLQQKQSDGMSSSSNAENALLEWPASFSEMWKPYPQTPTVQWTLELSSDALNQKIYTYAEIAMLPMTYQVRRLASLHGWSFRAEWQGITLEHLQSLLSFENEPRFIEVEDAQGRKSYFPLANLIKKQAMLVLFQGANALSPWHGGPLRFMAFDYVAEYNLGQVKAIRFLQSITPEQKTLSESALVQAGKYYCYDLKELKEHSKAGELKGF